MAMVAARGWKTRPTKPSRKRKGKRTTTVVLVPARMLSVLRRYRQQPLHPWVAQVVFVAGDIFQDDDGVGYKKADAEDEGLKW